MFEKLKAFIQDDAYFYTVLIIVVSVVSFGLGRWSGQELHTISAAAVVLTKVPEISLETSTTTPTSVTPGTGKLVASKKGTKYHLITCPGAKQMSEDNKIYFNSAEEAQAAGYTKAANCPGL